MARANEAAVQHKVAEKETPEGEKRWERRRERAERKRDSFPYWRRATFREGRLVWVCCDVHGTLPRTALRMLFKAEGPEYTPNRGNVEPDPDGMPHRLVEGRFVLVDEPTAEAPTVPSTARIRIYTDGSTDRAGGRSGCAAVFFERGQWREFASPLEDCTSVEAELMGVTLGLAQLPDPSVPFVILTDCEEVKRALLSEELPGKPDSIVRQTRTFYDTFVDGRVQVVRGHSGLPGNERAHRLAWEAMRNRRSVPETEPGGEE